MVLRVRDLINTTLPIPLNGFMDFFKIKNNGKIVHHM